MKTALLIVSFGTTHLDTFENTIAQTEKTIAKSFPDFPLYRAFSSKVICSRLNSEYGIVIDDVEEALKRIAEDGFSCVLIQPTLLIPGDEYEKLNASIQAASGNLIVSVGSPLICDDSDLDQMIIILKREYPLEEDSALLLMGHGTGHRSNSLYELLNCKMRNTRMRICTMEGTPSFADGVREMQELKIRNVILAPLLFAAGAHAKKNMAGDMPNSLRSMLENAGFSVQVSLQGLGEIPTVQELYEKKAEEAARRF